MPNSPPGDATSSPFPVCKFRRKVPSVKDLLGHEKVALETPGLGLVTLLQYHNFIPHVVEWKVNPEVGTTQYPTQAHRYRSLDPRQVFWEGDPVSLGLPGGKGGGLSHFS